MNVKDYIIAATFKIADDFMRDVRAVPEDKLLWKPLDNGRSVLDLAQECAHCPLWTVSTIADILGVKASVEEYEATATWTTVDACDQALRRHLVQYKECVLAFPEERIGESVTIQWGTFTMPEVFSFAHWNLTYHSGQVNYIQTLYGDREMR